MFFVEMKRSRLYSYETFQPVVVTRDTEVRDVNLHTVRLYQQRAEMEYVSVFKLREPTESIMESGDTRDGEYYASKGKIRHYGTEFFLYDQEKGGSSRIQHIQRACVNLTVFTVRLIRHLGNGVQE